MLVNAPGFVSRRVDSESYKSYFTTSGDDEGVVSFSNLGGDATLVVPSPRGQTVAYGHLAAFVRNAPAAQLRALWRVLGRVAESKLGDDPIWISTAGGGVAWLHVRLDSRPKYYAFAPYKSM